MSHPLESALNRALSIRLNLQITLSNLPIVEEWMDIHLDRFLEHLPTPPEMPPGNSQNSWLESPIFWASVEKMSMAPTSFSAVSDCSARVTPGRIQLQSPAVGRNT